MAFTTFSGPVRSQNGFFMVGPGSVVNLPNGTDTITVSPALHAGRIVRTNDATLVITLPTIVATIPPSIDATVAENNIGVPYTFFIETAATNIKIGTDGTDKFVGSLNMVNTGTAAVTAFAPGATNDFINLNGTTTGGIVGTYITVTALAALKYLVQGVVLASGAVVTPFADA